MRPPLVPLFVDIAHTPWPAGLWTGRAHSIPQPRRAGVRRGCSFCSASTIATHVGTHPRGGPCHAGPADPVRPTGGIVGHAPGQHERAGKQQTRPPGVRGRSAGPGHLPGHRGDANCQVAVIESARSRRPPRYVSPQRLAEIQQRPLSEATPEPGGSAWSHTRGRLRVRQSKRSSGW
jgi:hypothetical protein